MELIERHEFSLFSKKLRELLCLGNPLSKVRQIILSDTSCEYFKYWADSGDIKIQVLLNGYTSLFSYRSSKGLRLLSRNKIV